MSLEEFNEFRRQLFDHVSRLEHTRAQSSLFNTDSSSQMSYGSETEVNDHSKAVDRHTCDMLSSEQCCIADRTAGGWQRCHRRRSRRLTVSLERIAMANNLDLGVTDEDPHMCICLFHWRLIKYGNSDDLMNDEEVIFHETGETQYDKNEGDDEMKYSIATDNHTSSGHEDFDDEMDSSEEKVSDWQDVETKNTKTFPVDDSDDEEDQRDSEDDESGLCALSAASLRRYRKFFMIPTKASASKHAMLEGVENHFERLPVESADAIMHFVYTARNRINTIE